MNEDQKTKHKLVLSKILSSGHKHEVILTITLDEAPKVGSNIIVPDYDVEPHIPFTVLEYCYKGKFVKTVLEKSI